LSRERAAFEERGVELIVIGNGAPNFIEGFRERSGYEGAIYTDPELESYEALELRRDLRATLSLKTMGRAVQAFRKGNRQVATQGDALQQGGVFIVSPEGELVYSYKSQFAGDHPPVRDILAAAEALTQKVG
jgi:hypothetical protein